MNLVPYRSGFLFLQGNILFQGAREDLCPAIFIFIRINASVVQTDRPDPEKILRNRSRQLYPDMPSMVRSTFLHALRTVPYQ